MRTANEDGRTTPFPQEPQRSFQRVQAPRIKTARHTRYFIYRHVSLGRTILCSMHRHRSYRGPSLLCTKPMCLGCLLLKYYPHRVLINNDRCAHALCRNFAWRRSPDTKHAAPLLYRKSASQVAVFMGSWPE